MEKRSVIFLVLLFSVLVPLTTAYDFCENTTPQSELEITEIIYQKQANETTWEWELFEELIIEVTVENKNFTERNFDIELFLINENSEIEKFSSNAGDKIKTTSLKINQTQTLSFSIQLKEGIGGTYSLHAKLTDSNNESICTNLEAASIGNEVTVEIESEEKIIIVRNINGPTNATAGSNVEYIVEVINLGNIAEDRVLVIAYSANLNIREEREIIGLDIDESKNVTFNFTIPENALKEEVLLFSTEYSYKNETGFYYQFSDKDKILLLQVETQSSQIENITENQTEENQNETTPETTIPETTIPETTTTKDTPEIPYFWIIFVVSIILIITAIFFFLKYKGAPTPESQTPDTTTSAASDYVKGIQNKATPSSLPSKTTPSNVPVKPTPSNVPVKTIPSNVPVKPTPSNVPVKTIPSNVPVKPTPSNVPIKPTPSNPPNKPS